MSEAKKRKFHTPEFKAKVGLEALRGVKMIINLPQNRDQKLKQRQNRGSAVQLRVKSNVELKLSELLF